MVAMLRTGTAQRASCRGFTVIEVIVAAFLLTVGLLATTQLMVMATGHVAMSRQQSAAATLATQTIEQYRDITYTTLLNLSCDPVAGCTYTSTPTVGGITYTVATNVKPNNPATTMTTVAVTVTWGGNTYATSTILSPLQ